MNHVLQNAVKDATQALRDNSSEEDGPEMTAYIAVTAAWEVFNAYLIEKLVNSYLDNRLAGIEEGREIAAKAIAADNPDAGYFIRLARGGEVTHETSDLR